MRQKYWKIWGILVAAFIVLAISYYYGAVREKEEKEPAVYSVILYQNVDNEWATLMEGIEQAKKDYNVKVRYLTLGQEDSAQNQLEDIEREVRAGVSGILLAPVSSKEVEEGLNDISSNIPIITVETGVDNMVCITADNYRMGEELGKKILKDIDADRRMEGVYNTQEDEAEVVTVITEYMERDSVKERYRGLTDALKGSDIKIKIQNIQRQKGDFNLSLFVGKCFAESGNYVVALDKYCTQEAAKAWAANRDIYAENEMDEIKIYGIGNTAQTVSDLDNESLCALVYQNEFNMGYEGIRALVDKEKKGYITENFEIKYKLVTKETLYQEENERLLFPSV